MSGPEYEGFGPEGELIAVAAELARALCTTLDAMRVFPQHRAALPSLLAPVIEQLSILATMAVGPLESKPPMEAEALTDAALRAYPHTLRVARDISAAFAMHTAREMTYEDLQRRSHDLLAELASSSVLMTAPASRITSQGGDA